MVRYWYAATPLFIVGLVLVLAAPWLALFALAVAFLVALVALAGLVWTLVFVPYKLGQAIVRSWHSRSGAIPRTALALSPISSGEGETTTHVAAKA